MAESKALAAGFLAETERSLVSERMALAEAEEHSLALSDALNTALGEAGGLKKLADVLQGQVRQSEGWCLDGICSLLGGSGAADVTSENAQNCVPKKFN